MRTLRAYILLAALVAFIAYFGVYGLYNMVMESVGQGWALAGAALVALGTVVVAAVGITMIRLRPPDIGKGSGLE